MGKVAGAQNFDGRNWHEQHIAKRTRAALDEQDRAFAERHAGDTLAELACYLRRCAEHWGRSPAPCEIVGGSYIAERFGSWSDALRAAHLNPAYSHPHNRSNGRYQREKKRQIELYRAERDAKRAERERKIWSASGSMPRRARPGWRTSLAKPSRQRPLSERQAISVSTLPKRQRVYNKNSLRRKTT